MQIVLVGARWRVARRRHAGDSMSMQSEGGELALTITRRELLETSIAQLQTLTAFLSDQLSETARGSDGLETRACKEILCAVSRLIQIHQSRGADDE